MGMNQQRPARWHRVNMRIASSPLAARLLAATFHHLDRLVARLSRGRLTATSMMTGLPLIWLTTTGARTGKSRTVPLIGVLDGERLIVIASNWGQDQSPAWYYNLCARPFASVAHGRGASRYRTQEAEGAEYERLWQLAISRYPGYAAYRSRTARHIPIMILIPE
jgi:deazaflavin-dependent oxidoreductase (nitroreductase family)